MEDRQQTRDASTPPRGSKTARRGTLSNWIRFVRQYPLQALRRPYRAFSAGDGATGRGIAPPPSWLARGKTHRPRQLDRLPRIAALTDGPDGKRRSAGPPPAFHRPRRRNGGPGSGREPLRKKVNTQALRSGHGRIAADFLAAGCWKLRKAAGRGIAAHSLQALKMDTRGPSGSRCRGRGHSISAALSGQTGLALARGFLGCFAPA